MIKAEKWAVELKGKQSVLLTEYTMLTHGMKEAFTEKMKPEEADYLLITAQQDGLRIPVEVEEDEENDDDDELMKRVDKIIGDIEKELKNGRSKE